jgi:hypothetical protein
MNHQNYRRYILRLFDLNQQEIKHINRFLRWHISYIIIITIFFSIIYFNGLFRSNIFLKEKTIFILIAPLSTVFFILISPWRRQWLNAVYGMYLRLEGQGVFCLLAAVVFLFGFFIYSIFIWGLGALGPSLVYM